MQPEALEAGEQFGSIIFVTGARAGVGLKPSSGQDHQFAATVGKFIGVRSGRSFVIAMITEVTAEVPVIVRASGFEASAMIDLLGEIRQGPDGSSRFRRGVSEYPAIGDPAVMLGPEALRVVSAAEGHAVIEVGTLHQDDSLPARVDLDDLLSKHFAVLGTTGVGKSSATAVILSEILETRPDVRIFLLDGHNEYGRCFGPKANVINSRSLKLPFWLFNFEEMVDVIYGGRAPVAEELEILAEAIPIAKSMYNQYKTPDRAIRRKTDPRGTGYTIDTPVPYVIQDLLGQIDERMGRLENRAMRMHYHRLMTRIETIRNNPRYGFMFENANVGGDTMGELLRHLFRLDTPEKSMSVMQLAGLPAETVDAVVCVLCRLAFDFGLWSDGAVPLLFVCEEAHRYASADPSSGFHPTRRALTRIAREGRKYGVFLGLVTQRPAELEPTIISQCGTLFAMRMANDRDQSLLRSAVSDAATNLLSFIPTLGTREAVAFGEGVSVPARITFREMPAERLPRSEASQDIDSAAAGLADPDFVRTVIERWRGAHMSFRPRPEEGEREPDLAPPRPAPGFAAPPPGGPASDGDPDNMRFRLLKSRLEASLPRSDGTAAR